MRLSDHKQMVLFGFSIILLALGAIYSYYCYLMPLTNELNMKKMELQMTEQQADILQSKLKSTGSETSSNTIELQKKIPVKRLLEQALLEIEKAEIISDTNILEISVNGSNADEEVANGEVTTADKAIDDANKEENREADEKKNTEEIVLPNGIHQTTINMLGEASTHFELEKFLEKIESSQRIMTVDSLNITGPKEIIAVEESDQQIDFELTVSVYYYPTLNDLIEDLPQLDTPKVSERKNPFDTGTLENSKDQ
ncbi:pilus assembly protein PilO [Niallia circulans]|uniref:pilus assembly protein PilO n=1 Tax=Niallia circulans TaxID=1397 RepID=UPI001561304A|nr:pilus assembly protein PilO [Niallia circulans]NRG31538.1 pilus assembly protein PilO [Niallia circulans]